MAKRQTGVKVAVPQVSIDQVFADIAAAWSVPTGRAEDERTTPEIAALWGISNETARKRLRVMESRGKVVGRKVYYRGAHCIAWRFVRA